MLRFVLALVVLLQTVPVGVLAASHCRTCEHTDAAKAGVHCPLKKPAARTLRCHEHTSDAGAKVTSPDCTCGEHASQALKRGDNALPAPEERIAVRFVSTRAFPPAAPTTVERRTPPPDPPPRAPILL